MTVVFINHVDSPIQGETTDKLRQTPVAHGGGKTKLKTYKHRPTTKKLI